MTVKKNEDTIANIAARNGFESIALVWHSTEDESGYILAGYWDSVKVYFSIAGSPPDLSLKEDACSQEITDLLRFRARVFTNSAFAHLRGRLQAIFEKQKQDGREIRTILKVTPKPCLQRLLIFEQS